MPRERTGSAQGSTGEQAVNTHPKPGVSMLLADQGENNKPRDELQEETNASPDAVDEAVFKVMAKMFRISPDEPTTDATLGPTPTSEILLDGMPTAALVDTGSPLNFFLEAAAANREKSQPPAAWGKAVWQRLRPATCYGGTQLAIVGQAVCRLAIKGRAVDTLLEECPRRFAVGNGHPSPAWLYFESGRARRPTGNSSNLTEMGKTNPSPTNDKQRTVAEGPSWALDRVGTAGRAPTEQLSSSFKPLACQLDMSRLSERGWRVWE